MNKLDLKKIPLRASEAHYPNRQGFYGWMGVGGSHFLWNPELKIGFAYIPANICALDMTYGRAGRLMKIVADIVKKQGNYDPPKEMVKISF